MTVQDKFETWAIVEVMGHNTYAGFVTAENIAGAQMLRVDVPAIDGIPAFTKYVSPQALYGVTPCSEETAIARARASRSKPFDTWGIEGAFKDMMREKGLLIENKSEPDHYNDTEA